MFEAQNLWTQYQSIMMFGEMFIYHICACEHFACNFSSPSMWAVLQINLFPIVHDLLHFDSVFVLERVINIFNRNSLKFIIHRGERTLIKFRGISLNQFLGGQTSAEKRTAHLTHFGERRESWGLIENYNNFLPRELKHLITNNNNNKGIKDVLSGRSW